MFSSFTVVIFLEEAMKTFSRTPRQNPPSLWVWSSTRIREMSWGTLRPIWYTEVHRIRWNVSKSRELADVTWRFSITFWKGYGSWGGFLTTKRQMSSLIFMEEEGLEIYRLVRITSVTEKIMEEMLREASFMNIKKTGNKQYWKLTNINENINNTFIYM